MLRCWRRGLVAVAGRLAGRRLVWQAVVMVARRKGRGGSLVVERKALRLGVVAARSQFYLDVGGGLRVDVGGKFLEALQIQLKVLVRATALSASRLCVVEVGRSGTVGRRRRLLLHLLMAQQVRLM
jgi:hypothetical protein